MSDTTRFDRSDTTTPVPEPMFATPKAAPTPLDPPVILYNKKWRVPPFIVETQEDLDAIDPSEWTQNPPGDVGPMSMSYPKIYYNINVAPKIIGNADEEKALSGDWRELNLPEALVTAAQARLDAAASK